MSSVAEDLLNDFGGSGDEADDFEQDGLAPIDEGAGEDKADDDAMQVDGAKGDAAADGSDDAAQDAAADDDEANVDGGVSEAQKARVDKMKLGAVNDVRKVASLMQTLEPILKVRYFYTDGHVRCAARDANHRHTGD